MFLIDAQMDQCIPSGGVQREATHSPHGVCEMRERDERRHLRETKGSGARESAEMNEGVVWERSVTPTPATLGPQSLYRPASHPPGDF